MATAALIQAHWPLTKARLLSKVVLQAMVAHSSLIAPIWVSAILEVRLRLNISGSPFAYTWAGLPRYKMAGCQMCSGENSVPTWPFHCFDRSILTIDRSPELTAVSPRPFVKNTPDGSTSESRAPTTPVALRPVSASHVPAVVSAPGAQFRKDLRHPQKSSPGRWLRRGQRFFRNWAPGSEEKAGIFNQPGLPNITGGWTGDFSSGHYGAFSSSQMSSYGIGNGSYGKMKTTMDASRCSPIYGRATTVMPSSINQPIILYLGRPA